MIKLKHEQFRSIQYQNGRRLNFVIQEASKLEMAFKRLDIDAKIKEYKIGYASICFYIEGDVNTFSTILTSIDKIKEIVRAKKINKYVEGNKIAIELPNPFRQILIYGNLISDEYIENKNYYDIPIGIGYKDELIELNLKENNRVLISGNFRSGKKNALNVILTSILLNIDDCIIDMIDTSVDLTYLYDLNLINLVEIDSYINELDEALKENIKRIIVINDLKDFKQNISKLVNILTKAKNENAIVIMLTSSLDSLILTDELRKNIDINIALEASSMIESSLTINMSGQENLLGMGDSFIKQNGSVKRCQIAYISNEEIEGVISVIKGEGYNE